MQLLRSGFTIIEMLVVLAILTVLAGLLLPAIVKARESSARARCQSHLQHIGMAMQGYHNHFGALPPAVLYQPYQIVTGVESTNFGPNWAVLLLPYTEHSALWVPIATSVNRYREMPGESGWRSVRRERVSLFLCPSDAGSDMPYDSAAIGAGWARGNYGANHGPTRFGSASTTNSAAIDFN